MSASRPNHAMFCAPIAGAKLGRQQREASVRRRAGSLTLSSYTMRCDVVNWCTLRGVRRMPLHFTGSFVWVMYSHTENVTCACVLWVSQQLAQATAVCHLAAACLRPCSQDITYKWRFHHCKSQPPNKVHEGACSRMVLKLGFGQYVCKNCVVLFRQDVAMGALLAATFKRHHSVDGRGMHGDACIRKICALLLDVNRGLPLRVRHTQYTSW